MGYNSVTGNAGSLYVHSFSVVSFKSAKILRNSELIAVQGNLRSSHMQLPISH